MANEPKKKDLRDGLPQSRVPVQADLLEREQDAPVADQPEIMTPEVGKNVPSGQTTKG